MRLATTAQVRAVNVTLRHLGQFDNKAEIIGLFTSQRTTHSSQLTVEEARGLLSYLMKDKKLKPGQASQAMTNKLFAMAHEMGWIGSKTIAVGDQLKTVKDYSRVHDWVLKYGWKKEPLNKYSYSEMPKLVSVFEFGPYKSYLAGKRK